MALVGIDFGTSRARVAILEDGEPRLVAVDGNAIDLECVVSVEAEGCKVGQAALRRAVTHPQTTIRRFKPLLGVTLDRATLTEHQPHLSCVEQEDADPELQLGDESWSIAALTSEIFDRLADRAAEHAGDGGEHRAVLAVPAWFRDEQSAALRRAVELSRLPPTLYEPEPLAAAMGLRLDAGPRRPVAVVDVGASNFSIAIYEAGGEQEPKLLALETGNRAGDSVDREILRLALERLKLSKPDACTREMVRQACETLKLDLSQIDSARVQIPFLPTLGGPAQLTFDRKQLARASSDLVMSLRSRAMAALREAGTDERDLVEVFLIGGMSPSVHVSKAVTEIFGRSPTRSNTPTGVIALGAARLAARRASPAPPREERAVIPPPPPAPPRTSGADEGRAAEVPGPPPAEKSPRTEPTPLPSTAPPPPTPPPIEPPSRTSIAPGRPSVAAAAPVDVSSGRVVNPVTVEELFELPLTRPLTGADLEAIAIPTLLLRIMGRPNVTGTVHLTLEGEAPLSIPVINGRAVITENEQTLLLKACSARQGTYRYEEGKPDAGRGYPTAMLALVTQCLRQLMRPLRPEDLRAALGDILQKGPTMSEKRRAVVHRLGLSQSEVRLVRVGFDGSRTGVELVDRGGAGPRTTLQLLTIFQLYRLLEWVEVDATNRHALDEVLRERASNLDKQTHFQALSCHWAATAEEIEEAYRKIMAETARDGAWYKLAPDAAVAIRKRAEEAYEFLRDEERRTSYRAKHHGDMNYAAITDFLAQKARAASMHDDKREYATTAKKLQEVQRTRSKVTRSGPARIRFEEDD